MDTDALAALQARVAGRYSIESELGRGGMGVVYRARDVALDRRIAIKLLPPEFAVQGTLRERFLREARLAARLSHPNIVPMHAVEEHPDAVFFVMGYIEGETLGGRLERAGALPPPDVSSILQQVAWALAYAHGHGVIHRDVKPDNILLERGTGRAYVMDFGIARAQGPTSAEEETGSRLTQVGQVIGTAAFMSPEQAAGEAVDGRSDLYSLGVVGFVALTGQLPFNAPSSQALLAKHLTEIPPPVASLRQGVPAELARAVDRLLSKPPEQRFSSGEELAAALGSAGAVRGEVAPALRNFLRNAELHIALMFKIIGLIVVVLIVQKDAWIALLFGGIAGVAGAAGDIFVRARALLRMGYRWADVREAVHLDAEARAEESRQLRTGVGEAANAPALVRAVVWLGVGIGAFAALAIIATVLRNNNPATMKPIGIPLILLGGILMIVSSVPLMNLVQQVAGRRPRKPGQNTGIGLNLWAGGFGEWFFRLAARGIKPAAPRGTAGGLEQLLEEAEAAVPAYERAAVRQARMQVEAMVAEAQRLRARQRELERSIAEAGESGAARLRGALAEVVAGLERTATAVDALRVKLLLVRSGVAPASELAESN